MENHPFIDDLPMKTSIFHGDVPLLLVPSPPFHLCHHAFGALALAASWHHGAIETYPPTNGTNEKQPRAFGMGQDCLRYIMI